MSDEYSSFITHYSSLTTMLLDLQIHTIATPGHASWDAETLARYAAGHGFGIVAVTDHNTVAQVAPVQDAGSRYGVRVIAGVELDSAYGGKLWHTLIYGVAPDTPAIVELAASVAERNAADAQNIIAALRAGGHALQTAAGVEHPTVAAVGLALVRDGIVPEVEGVDDESAGMAFILRHMAGMYRPLGVDEIIDVAHAHGGLAVLAHPGRSKGVYAIPADESDIRSMAERGLDGIEALYAQHSPEQQAFYGELARRYDLLVTAGSDSHHPAQGLVGRPVADCAAFLERVGI